MPPQNEQPRNRPPDRTPEKPWWRWLVLVGYLVLGVLLVWGSQGIFRETVRTIPYSEFKDYLAKKEVAECVLRPDEIRGRIVPKPPPAPKRGSGKKAKSEQPAEAPAPFTFRTVRIEDRKLVEELQAAGVNYRDDVARAFAETFGLTELYLADLDAIAGAEPNWAVYDTLRRAGSHLWVDAGVRQAQRALQLGRVGLDVVVGLETVAGPAALAECVAALGGRVIFSLDLRGGVPLGDTSAWAAPDAWSIATGALGLGVARLLVLDLARVGAGSGTGTEALCTRLAGAHPHVEVWAGGGVRDRADLLRLRACGVRAVLLASALHDGALARADLAGL